MASFTFFTLSTFFLGFFCMKLNGLSNDFSSYYTYLWGDDLFSLNPQGSEVRLKMDKSNGGAGFRSKLDYGSGWFHIRMKIPERKTGGIVTSFYLTSAPDNGNHFEIDYEFLGSNGTVQTNVYDNNSGHREQSFNLWFDPSQDFHSYDILWNSAQILFLIDNFPIRVFKNNEDKGVAYPKNKTMHIEASIWNADWAGVVEWNNAPFISHYSDFRFDACTASANDCDSDCYFWNLPTFRELDDQQKSLMAAYRNKFIVYDYCSQPSTRKPECSYQD